MSEKRYTVKQINEAAEHAVGCVSAVLGDDPKFVNIVRNVTHMLQKTLEDLPAPPEEFSREVWVIELMSGRYANLEHGILMFPTEAKAQAYTLGRATPIPVTVTYTKGHSEVC